MLTKRQLYIHDFALSAIKMIEMVCTMTIKILDNLILGDFFEELSRKNCGNNELIYTLITFQRSQS